MPQVARYPRLQAAIAGVAAGLLVSPAMAGENASLIPDLSGQWGRPMVFFEPPLSGPGPVMGTRKPDGTVDYDAPVGDHTNPILKPETAETLKRLSDMALAGMVPPSPHNQCWPEPPPFVLAVQFGMQLLQHANGVTLLYLADNKVRHVPMNVPHPAQVTPTWQGHSVGWYEGDTLVIDTVGIKAGPLSTVDLWGTPHSEALHVIERYRLIDGEAASEAQRKHGGDYINPNANPALLAFEFLAPVYGRGPIDEDTNKKGLQVEITVEDAGAFTTPWTALVTYRPVIGDWPETVCAENPHLWGTVTVIPTARTPDF